MIVFYKCESHTSLLRVEQEMCDALKDDMLQAARRRGWNGVFSTFNAVSYKTQVVHCDHVCACYRYQLHRCQPLYSVHLHRWSPESTIS